MIKKLFAKLIALREKDTNAAFRKAKEESAERSRQAQERHQQIMAGRERKYTSEQTTPSDKESLNHPGSESRRPEE